MVLLHQTGQQGRRRGWRMHSHLMERKSESWHVTLFIPPRSVNWGPGLEFAACKSVTGLNLMSDLLVVSYRTPLLLSITGTLLVTITYLLSIHSTPTIAGGPLLSLAYCYSLLSKSYSRPCESECHFGKVENSQPVGITLPWDLCPGLVRYSEST